MNQKSLFRMRRGHRTQTPVLFAFVAASLSSISCTDCLLSRYRDDAFLTTHKYAIGERYADVDGIRLCYQERGEGEDIVILPGLGMSIDFWQLNVPALAERYHVVAVDPPGFGKSDKPDVPYDLTWMADRILTFMDTRHIERANLIGGSMGGHLALLLATGHPNRVNKLVLMGSSGAWPPPGFLLAAGLKAFWNDAVVSDHLRRNWPNIYRKIFIRQTPITQELFRYQMALRANAARYAPEGRASARAMRSIFFNSCRDRLAEVSRPTLLVWGASDQVHLLDEAQAFRRGLPDSRLVVVPDAGHEVMIDQSATFNQLVLQFLDRGTQAVADSQPTP
jgi:pimeloyl-ACP methyl ester carboxylesterase